MNRRLLVFAMIAIPVFLMLFALHTRVEAAPTLQLIRDTRPAEAEAEPLSQPLTVTIHQQAPLTLSLLLENEGALFSDFPPTMPVTLSFTFQFALTQTLTSTVPSSVTLTFSDGLALSFPVSLALGTAPSATVVVTAPAAIETTSPTRTVTPTATRTPTASPTPSPTATVTATEELSPTATLTATEVATVTATVTATDAVSPTEPLSTAVPGVTSTVNITANLRAAPDVESEVVGQAGLGLPVVVAGLSADGAWYFLSNGAWIAVGLLDNAPANPPVANEAVISTVRATATALAVDNPAPTVAATPTPAGLLLPTPTATPQPLPPSVTVNANLRSGPGLEFPIVGGTIANQPVSIVARTDNGDWFLLDNGGWVAAFLLANPPDIAAIPVFNPDEPLPETPTTAPVTTTTALTTTATVTPSTPTTTTLTTTGGTTATLGVLDNLYLVDAAELLARYDRALGQIDSLITQAGQDEALLQQDAWVQAMTNAIALLRATDARVRTLQPTALLQSVHNNLVTAADAFDEAATLVAQGVDQSAPDQFDAAFAAITRGNASLGNAADQIDEFTP